MVIKGTAAEVRAITNPQKAINDLHRQFQRSWAVIGVSQAVQREDYEARIAEAARKYATKPCGKVAAKIWGFIGLMVEFFSMQFNNAG